MSWNEAALWWLPTASIAVVTLVGVLAVLAQPWRPARKYWVLASLLCGGLAIGGSGWQQARSRAALGEEAARLRELGARLDEVGRLLPAGPGKTPDETFDTVAAALLSLNAKIGDLEEQVLENSLLRQQAAGVGAGIGMVARVDHPAALVRLKARGERHVAGASGEWSSAMNHHVGARADRLDHSPVR